MRILLYIGVLLTGLLLPFWACVGAVVCYSLWRPGYELITIGILIDIQFGMYSPGFAYVYTTTITGVVLTLELLKPRLSFYTDYSE